MLLTLTSPISICLGRATDIKGDIRVMYGKIKGQPYWAASTVVIFLLALAIGVRASGSLDTPEIAENPLLSVETFTAHYHDSYAVEQMFTGQVTPRRASELGFERGGLVKAVLVNEGTQVQQGQVLAFQDSRVLKAQLAEMTAREVAARANLTEADAAFELARADHARQAVLLKKGHISDQRFENAQSEFDIATARHAAAKATQESLVASVAALEAQLDLAQIVAPYSGTITARYIDEGTVAAPGNPVFRLIENRELELHVGVPGDVAATLQTDAPYEVEIGGTKTSAILKAKIAEVEKTTRTVTVILALPKDKPIRAGDLGRLNLTHTYEAKGLWVPTAALSEGQRGLWTVFAVVPQAEGVSSVHDTIVQPRQVQVIHAGTDQVYIRGMINEDDVLVGAGSHRLVASQPVALSSTNGG